MTSYDFEVIAHPTVLENDIVRLRPLGIEDIPALLAQAAEAEIWRYMRVGILDSHDRMLAWVEAALLKRDQGTEYPFAIIDKATGQLVGGTRYLNIDTPNGGIEIGGSWLGSAFRRTSINTNAKYLLLRYAFEQLECIRVQLRTDSRNLRSQRAIEHLGAVREGILRKDFIYPDGYQRSTVFYSIIDDDWPAAKQCLQLLIERRMAWTPGE